MKTPTDSPAQLLAVRNKVDDCIALRFTMTRYLMERVDNLTSGRQFNQADLNWLIRELWNIVQTLGPEQIQDLVFGTTVPLKLILKFAQLPEAQAVWNTKVEDMPTTHALWVFATIAVGLHILEILYHRQKLDDREEIMKPLIRLITAADGSDSHYRNKLPSRPG